MSLYHSIDPMTLGFLHGSAKSVVDGWARSFHVVSCSTTDFIRILNGMQVIFHSHHEKALEKRIILFGGLSQCSKNTKGILPTPPFGERPMPAYKKARRTEAQHASEDTMARREALEVRLEDRTTNKWSVSLREDVFDSFISQGGDTLHKVFGDGSLFSPLLFGKFFDPADAFPLWDFESEVLLAGVRSSAGCNVDWLITDTDYVLKSELPGLKKYDVQISVENGKVLEISGQWRHGETSGKDWRSGQWWGYGYVRRIELPENANWRKTEANIDNHFLEIKIPKSISESSNMPQSSDVEPNDS